MTIVDEDGTEFELEVLSSLDYNGFTYLAVIPAGVEDVYLMGEFKYNPFGGNAFRFHGMTDPRVLANRKK